jgi:tetratricopeptide (TPR) repeat protein
LVSRGLAALAELQAAAVANATSTTTQADPAARPPELQRLYEAARKLRARQWELPPDHPIHQFAAHHLGPLPEHELARLWPGRQAPAKGQFDSISAVVHYQGKASMEKGDADEAQGHSEEAIKHFAEAIRFFDEAIQLDPNNALAYLDRARALRRMNQAGAVEHADCDTVIKAFDEAIRVDPNNPTAYVERGGFYLQVRWEYTPDDPLTSWNKAVADFDTAIRLDPDNALAYYNRADAWLDPDGTESIARRREVWRERRITFDEVIKDLDRAIQLDPTHADWYSLRGASYQDEGDYDKAIKDFDEVLRLDPNNEHAYDRRGETWLIKGRYDAACEDFEAVLRLCKYGHAYAYYNCGRARHGKRQFDEAIKDYDQAIRLHEEQNESISALLRKFGRAERARRPLTAQFYDARGKAWAAKGDNARAIQDFSEAIRLDPSRPAFFNNRGVAWRNEDEFAHALEDYSQAIRLDPSFALYHKNRSQVWSPENVERILGDLTEAIRLDPHDAELYRMRGREWADIGDHDRAIEDYHEAVRLDPTDPRHHFGRGQAWFAKKDYDSAIQDFDEAIRRRTERVEKLRSLNAPEIILRNELRQLARYEDARRKAAEAGAE